MSPDVPNRIERAPAIATRPRRWGFLLPELDADGAEVTDHRGRPVYPTLTCPEGHLIHWDWNIAGDCFPRCVHRIKQPGGPVTRCELRIWVCPMPRRERPGSPRLVVAEVDWREIAYMSERYLSPDEIIRFLGMTWMRGAA